MKELCSATLFLKFAYLDFLKSVFASTSWSKEVARYLGREIFKRVGAEVKEIDRKLYSTFVMAHFKVHVRIPDYHFLQPLWHSTSRWWSEDPFTLSVHWWHYGRGVDDDKGHITARLSGLRKPCKITMIFSQYQLHHGRGRSLPYGLDKYLEKHADKLRGTDLLWEQGTKKCLGTVKSLRWEQRDCQPLMPRSECRYGYHSQLWRCCGVSLGISFKPLTSLRAADGAILVEGWPRTCAGA